MARHLFGDRGSNSKMQQRSHVPKFGNWDGDNVPYTAYFENARKEKVGAVVRINPNDPEQNPEAFNIGGAGNGASNSPVSISPDNEVAARTQYDGQKHNHSRRNLSSGSSSNGSSANPVVKTKHQHKKSGSPSPPPLPGPNNADDFSYRSVSVPKFGQWDENDRRSGEGFTVIFNKVKEEKHIAAATFPPAPPLQTSNNYQARQEKEKNRKKCCCLF